MIKRRFYRVDHGEKDDASSDSSSSSSGSDVEAQTSEDSDTESQPQPKQQPDSDVEAHEQEDDDSDNDKNEIERPPSFLKPQSPSSSSSGYESEDSSAHEVEEESAGLLSNVDGDDGIVRDGQELNGSLVTKKESGKIVETLASDHPVADDVASRILRCRSVFKCRLCPKIVCLNEESLKAHLNSKRHVRSEKLLKDGRLKRILNSDGEEEVISEDDGETHAERHARIVALAQSDPKKKGKGRQRQRERLKRKKQKNPSDVEISGPKKENRAKRRRKNAE